MFSLHALRHATIVFYAAHEYPALFGLILIEEMGLPLPLPGDTLIAYSGTLERHHGSSAIAVIATVAFAAALGSSLLYMFARRGGPALVEKLERVKILHMNRSRVERMQGWFRKRGPIAIILGRLIPGLRTPTSVMAGLADVPYRVFVPSTTVAAIIWSAFYYYLGDALRRAYRPIWRWAIADVDRFIGLAVVLIVVVALVVSVWRGRKQRTNAEPVASRESADEATRV